MSIRQLFLGMSILAGASIAHAEMVLITHPSNSVSSLPQSQVSRLFLGQTSTFPNGSRATPLDVQGDTKAQFHRDVLKRQTEQVEKYWARMIFTGKAQPPREVKAREVKAVVAETPGAISYIDSSQVDSSVKVIRVN